MAYLVLLYGTQIDARGQRQRSNFWHNLTGKSCDIKWKSLSASPEKKSNEFWLGSLISAGPN